MPSPSFLDNPHLLPTKTFLSTPHRFATGYPSEVLAYPRLVDAWQSPYGRQNAFLSLQLGANWLKRYSCMYECPFPFPPPYVFSLSQVRPEYAHRSFIFTTAPDTGIRRTSVGFLWRCFVPLFRHTGKPDRLDSATGKHHPPSLFVATNWFPIIRFEG